MNQLFRNRANVGHVWQSKGNWTIHVLENKRIALHDFQKVYARGVTFKQLQLYRLRHLCNIYMIALGVLKIDSRLLKHF